MYRVAGSEFAPFRALGTRLRVPAADPAIPRYEWLNHGQLFARVRAFAAALAAVGIERGDNGASLGVLICGENSAEWIIADIGTALAACTSLVIHTTFPDLSQVIVDHGISVVVVQPQLFQRIRQSFGDASPKPSRVVLLPGDCTGVDAECTDGWRVVSFAEFERAGSMPCPSAAPLPTPDEGRVVSVMFTSGSTGRPKAIPFTERAWLERIGLRHNPDQLQLGSGLPAEEKARTRVWFSYQPLSHGLDRVAVWSSLLKGGRVGVGSDDKATILQELQAVAPTAFAGTPRFWQSLMETHDRALQMRLVQQPEGAEDAIRRQLIEETSKQLGHRIESITYGGALTDKVTTGWLFDVWGNKAGLSESYGTTECGGIARNNYLLPGLEAKLRDLPELGYHASAGVGELLVQLRGGVNFEGYMSASDVESSAGAVDGGFYCTGDIVTLEVEADGRTRVTIVDRVKNVFKLTQGEFVAPGRLESMYYADCPSVKQIMVSGRPDQSAVVAVVVLADDAGDVTMANLRQEFIDAARKHRLLPYEIPLAVHIEASMWTVENGGRTTSNKCARNTLEARYASVFEQLYSSVATKPHVGGMADAVAEYLTTSAATFTLPGMGIAADTSTLTIADLGMDSLAASQLLQRIWAVGDPRKELSVKSLYMHPLQALKSHIVLGELLVGDGNAAASHGRMHPDWAALRQFTRRTAVSDRHRNNNNNNNNNGSTGEQDRGPMVLLTGVTGFVGPHLLAALLRWLPGHSVVCMVRAHTRNAGLDRIAAALSSAGEHELASSVRSGSPNVGRVQVILGDLALPQLGIDADPVAHQLLCSGRLAMIVHNGAKVSSVLPFEVFVTWTWAFPAP